jgi:hypothetical protein
MTNRLDRPGKVAQKVIWTPPLDSSRRVDQDPCIERLEVWMREIWLPEDLHVTRAVRPGGPGG